MNLSDEDIKQLVGYARDKFEAERYPLAPSLRPIRDALAKANPKPIIPEPLPPPEPYVPSLLMQRKRGRRR
jgi:hypothetical protein